jgi:hypothetical protein
MDSNVPLQSIETFDLLPLTTLQDLIIAGVQTISHRNKLIPVSQFAPDISMDEYISDGDPNNVCRALKYYTTILDRWVMVTREIRKARASYSKK